MARSLRRWRESAANATTTYLHPDHLGGTNVATDEDGEVTQTLDYYPYGSQRIASGSFNEQRGFIGEELMEIPNSRTSTPATTKVRAGNSFRRIRSSSE